MKNAQVLIVKKKRGGGHGHHGGAWKVAYADFVTAMMAFFLVMWIITQAPEVKSGIAGYFRDPGIFDAEKGNSIISGGNTGVDPKGAPTAAMVREVSGLSESDRKALEQSARRIKEALVKLPDLNQLAKQVEIEITDEGLRIQLVESANSSFFDTGSAALRGESVELLAVIARELAANEYPLVLEGHTDSRQYSSSEGYTNWELSADRANAARRVLQKNGVVQSQIQQVRGLADVNLRVPEDPLDARNRRVSIIVKRSAETTAASAAAGPS
jgi:chemotaxis protein MotB